MSLIAYADESGTHDELGLQPGSEAPVFGGFIADQDSWIKFRWHWASVLAKYTVPYFHYRELSQLTTGWTQLKQDTFLFELAAVAGAHVPVGSMINLRSYRKSGGTDYAYQFVFERFFADVQLELNSRWPKPSQTVTIILDQNSNKKWISHFAATFEDWQKKDARFKKYIFGDKKDPAHAPLQAADLIAYRVRKRAHRRLESGKPQEKYLFDTVLFRAIHAKPKAGQRVMGISALRNKAAEFASRDRTETFGRG